MLSPKGVGCAAPFAVVVSTGARILNSPVSAVTPQSVSVRMQTLPPAFAPWAEGWFNPPRPQAAAAQPPPLLVRRRLHSLLDGAREGLVWVSGPSGAGKTSLMRTWTDARRAAGTPCLWIQLDATDAEPAVFFRHLRLALLSTLATPQARNALRLPAWREAADAARLSAFAQRYFRAWTAALPKPLILVFDACEAAGADAALPLLLDQLLQALPAGALMLAAGTDPLPLTLHRWAASGRCLTLGWEDLRADDDEARELALAWGQPQPEAAQCALAGGWMAAWAVLLSAARCGEAAPAADRIFEACAGAAYSGLDPLTRRVLAAVARQPTASAEEAAVLSDVANAGDVLAALWRLRWFVERQISFDGQVRYALHPLLRAHAAARQMP
ncbi:MAG: hypothetical protein EPO12_19210 [Aquabacterium sp.]|nr:MAG: hypothetical protein EPO12_19210 [Aquabacterium sp.]